MLPLRSQTTLKRIMNIYFKIDGIDILNGMSKGQVVIQIWGLTSKNK